MIVTKALPLYALSSVLIAAIFSLSLPLLTSSKFNWAQLQGVVSHCLSRSTLYCPKDELLFFSCSWWLFYYSLPSALLYHWHANDWFQISSAFCGVICVIPCFLEWCRTEALSEMVWTNWNEELGVKLRSQSSGARAKGRRKSCPFHRCIGDVDHTRKSAGKA